MPLLMTYEPSGKIHPAGLLGLPLFMALGSSVLAWLYVLGTWYGPVLPRPLLTVAWGLATGFWAGLGIYCFNVRGPKLAVVLVLIGALTGYALSWAFWTERALSLPEVAFYVRKTTTFQEAGQAGDYFGKITDIILDPARIMAAAKAAHDQGLWEVFRSGRNFTGELLLLVWLGEAALYFGLVVYKSRAAARRPFSEIGGYWLKRQNLPAAAGLPEGSEVVIDRIKNGDVNYLGAAPREKKSNKSSHLVLQLFTAKKPGDRSFVSVTHMKIGRRGRLEPKKLVENLAVDSKMAETLKTRFGPIPPPPKST